MTGLAGSRWRASRMIMAAKGGRATDITVGDCIQMVQIAAEVTKASGRTRGYRSSFFYQLVRSLGRFPDNAPASTERSTSAVR